MNPGLAATRAVLGEIEALLDKRIDVGGALLAASLARMQQHVFDDGVGALSVLEDLFEIALQQAGQFLAAHRDRLEYAVQLVG